MPSAVDDRSEIFYSKLSSDLASTCVSLQKSFSLTPLELYYKIESYQVKRDAETHEISQTVLDDLRLSLQENLERKQQRQPGNGNGSNAMMSGAGGGVTPLKRKYASTGQTPTPLRNSPLSDTYALVFDV